MFDLLDKIEADHHHYRDAELDSSRLASYVRDLLFYIEEKFKDLDFEAQELLTTGEETAISHASGIHRAIDMIQEVINDMKHISVAANDNAE